MAEDSGGDSCASSPRITREKLGKEGSPDSGTVGPNNRLPSGKGPIRSNSGESCDWLKQYVAVARYSGIRPINNYFYEKSDLYDP